MYLAIWIILEAGTIIIISENHLVVNEKGDVGMAKLFSKKYRNKG